MKLIEKFVINGGIKLTGEVSVSGSKNVALKAVVAACLTDGEVIIKNIPLISDLSIMFDIIKDLGGDVTISGHTAKIRVRKFLSNKISLEKAAEIRTSSMLIVPLLKRMGSAIIPNPGGCRIGARPIDRVVEGLKTMGVKIDYQRSDGYFHAALEEGFKGAIYKFEKNTHTGTETLILAGVLAKGETILQNAAQEPEIDELIDLLCKMGADIKRIEPRTIVIKGVERLHGTEFTVGADRNEIVTLAIAAIVTRGNVLIKGGDKTGLVDFLIKLKEIGAEFKEEKNGIRFFAKNGLSGVDIATSAYPGFMTDWQGPWAVLMTRAKGKSVIHETVYENRFGYMEELKKMGADIEAFNPKVDNPSEFYNFNLSDDKKEYKHAIRISGPINLHNGVVKVSDLRAGATLVLAALAAEGESVIFGINHLDRGYENFEERLRSLGAKIVRIKE
ncbi:MAG: UDP-N-acetylglucosamine 1-carboxyvinyltransferase [Patescibacteria group bacterium]|nr:UDP-N-acetylglucosamine 1-carboxyvinyltransferase [Patescibacteria group bacterium]